MLTYGLYLLFYVYNIQPKLVIIYLQNYDNDIFSYIFDIL